MTQSNRDGQWTADFNFEGMKEPLKAISMALKKIKENQEEKLRMLKKLEKDKHDSTM